MQPIVKSKNQFIGDWDLNKLGIIAVDIHSSSVRDLTRSSNSSAGVLKKDNLINTIPSTTRINQYRIKREASKKL